MLETVSKFKLISRNSRCLLLVNNWYTLFQGISGCSQGCQNTVGSFRCFCRRTGYVLDSDQRSCKGELCRWCVLQYKTTVRLKDRLTDRMSDWHVKLTEGLTDWLTGYYTDLLSEWRINWMTDWLDDLLTGWLANLVTDRLTDWQSDWLTDLLADRLIKWKTDLQTDWLADLLTV